jgi:hypothetical protein
MTLLLAFGQAIEISFETFIVTKRVEAEGERAPGKVAGEIDGHVAC